MTASLTTYYNGACPICSAEIGHYRAEAQRLGRTDLAWIDVSEHASALEHHGLGQNCAYRRLYAETAEGRLLVGVDAFIAIWQQLPRWRWLARVTRVPVIRPVAKWAYEHVAARAIYHWNKRRLRKQARAA
ncbi:MAG: thiol-disulfide oxidoreductase DCC family protein [Rhodothalassiaceae bacterium]